MAALAHGIDKVSKLVPDAYDRPARLYPGLIALSPLPVMILCVYARHEALVSSLIALAASCGCAYAMMRIVRNAGQRLQVSLFDAWGGAPTTQLLRHSNRRFDVHTKARFHKALSKGLGKKMPTAAAEMDDPLAADELYRAASAWLISQTRDVKKFPLLFKENIAFGFHRNALGIRSFGIVVALGCLAYCAIYVGIQSGWTFLDIPEKTQVPIWISMLYSALLLGAWLFLFTKTALKETAFAYAERLIQSLDVMAAMKSRAAKDS